MKKFLTVAVLLLLLAMSANFAIYNKGFYFNLNPSSEIALPFRVEDKELTCQMKNGEYLPLTLRGVDVSASMPGHYATAYAADEEDYLRWFTAIGELGANAVRASTVMDDDFYNALYEYNTTHEEPLYLLQGTSVSDYANNGPGDAYGDIFFDSLVKDGRDLVDIIHGRKNLASTGLQGSGHYRRDLSQWVAGYLIGTEWTSDTIAYTDHRVIHSDSFRGTYFATADGSTAFEAMLAQVMEEVTSYETEKYRTQRPIGFVSDPEIDFLEYGPEYERQLLKYAYLDAEHVKPQEAMKAGCFAAYRFFDFCADFADYLSQDQKKELAPILSKLDRKGIYGGYPQLLAQYHTMPVLAAGYGFSSSRGATVLNQAPLTEQEQGERLAEVNRQLEKAGFSGSFVSTWQDTWERRTWNTAFATVPTKNYLWHDLQTDGQSYGLMAFDPGEDTRICVLDGSPAEWEEQDLVLEKDGVSLSAKYDAEGLYLLIQKQDLATSDPFYISIDVSPETGSTACSSPVLRFDRAADFLLCLTGPKNSRLRVQERYNAARENFLYESSGQDPFSNYPAKDSPKFVPVGMAVENSLILDEVTPETRPLQRLGSWETGKLTHGCGDSKADSYNSLSDFCYGENCVEVRLPWLLLNVADPSSMRVHRDYYQHYGVETTSIKELWLGVAQGADESVEMQSFRLKGWNRTPDYQERLKQSYFVLQSHWKGGVKDAGR